jgi:hypothetical protein
MLEAIVFGHGDSETQPTGLEGPGRIRSLLLDVEAGVTLAVEQRGPAFAEGDRSYVRQNTCITPHTEAGRRGGGTSGDIIALRGLFEKVHVIPDIKRAGTEGAEGLWDFRGDVVLTSRTLKVCDSGHILDVTGFGGRGIDLGIIA